MPNIVIYTSENCKYCKNAKEFFANNNLEYTEISVKDNPEAVNFIKESTGQMGVPVILIDLTDIVVGFDEVKLKELLYV